VQPGNAAVAFSNLLYGVVARVGLSMCGSTPLLPSYRGGSCGGVALAFGIFNMGFGI
jgi:hypothetical protein